MGRWSGQSFRLADNKTLSIITAYRPCKQSGFRISSRTSYHQQYVMLRDKGIEDPDPRHEFAVDIIQLINTLESDPKHFVILMLDANESMDKNGSGIRKIIKDTTMIDTFEEFSQEKLTFPTYVRGSKRINFILSTHNLMPYIRQAGCFAFYDDHLDSDHRGLYVDIDNILLDNTIENQRPPKRNIGTKSPQEDIIKYIINVNKQFISQNIYKRCKASYDKSILEQNKENKVCINSIYNLDKQISEIILSCEKKLCKHIHESEWSVELHQASIEVKYWMTKYKASRNKKNVTLKLSELLQELPDDRKQTILHNSSDPLKEWIKASKHKTELKKHAKELRQKGLIALAEIREKQGNKNASNIVKKIIRSENNKGHWEVLSRTLHKNIKSGINYLEVPDKDSNGNFTNDTDLATSWKTISDPVDMNKHLIQRNIKHFGQANGSNFTVEPLLQMFEYEGTSDYVDLLMEGKFDEIINLNDMNRGTMSILQKLNKSQKLENIDDHITFEEWISALKLWSGRTSTSPSGRHLGHLKVCLATIHPIDKEDKSIKKIIKDVEGDNINEVLLNMQREILQVYYHISLICLNTGASLPRWQQVTTTMIKKDNTISKINKLRVIHLYEADYNLLLKILWARRLVWHVHDNH